MGSVFQEFDWRDGNARISEEAKTSLKRKIIVGGFLLVAAIVLILLIGVPVGMKKSDDEPQVAASSKSIEDDQSNEMASLAPSSSPTLHYSDVAAADLRPSVMPSSSSPDAAASLAPYSRGTAQPSPPLITTVPHKSPTHNPSAQFSSPDNPRSTPSPTLLKTSQPVSGRPTSMPAKDSTHIPTSRPTRTTTKAPTQLPASIPTTRKPTLNPTTLQPTPLKPSAELTYYPTYAPTNVFFTPAPSDATTLTKNGTFSVLRNIAHDSEAYTQGLVTVFRDNQALFYEGTGQYNKSIVRKWDPTQQTVLEEVALGSQYFGEGVTYFETPDGLAQIVQLTWKDQTAFVYDADTLAQLAEFTFNTTTNEGWGITYDPQQHVFYVTDGSAFLHVWNATTFEEIRKVFVTLQDGFVTPRDQLNEIEWDPISGTILSNVWLTNTIVRIDPVTGYILAVYDMELLYVDRPTGTDVLNGIALVLNETTGGVIPNEYWVTGKLWPVMFHVRFDEA